MSTDITLIAFTITEIQIKTFYAEKSQKFELKVVMVMLSLTYVYSATKVCNLHIKTWPNGKLGWIWTVK